MVGWRVERVSHFAGDDFLVGGLAHFGFHLRDGRYVAISHPRHHLAVVGADGRPEWAVAAGPGSLEVTTIHAELEYPMYADVLPDRSLIVSNLGNARLYRIEPWLLRASVLVDGRTLGMADMGNCVVDREGCIWVSEVTGCRLWRFDPHGRVLLALGDGQPGFDVRPTPFDEVRFSWIYDIRLGADGRLFVLDSRNFALRVVDLAARQVLTIAGGGLPGVFGSDPSAKFDGPISLALDEHGTAYVGDRHNHVLKAVSLADGKITTIAGRGDFDDEAANDPAERDPLGLNLPQISSLDYFDGRLFVPTDLSGDRGDLAILVRS
jgi:sugar lactone lactonase YvrE